jgi:hypothetical protein
MQLLASSAVAVALWLVPTVASLAVLGLEFARLRRGARQQGPARELSPMEESVARSGAPFDFDGVPMRVETKSIEGADGVREPRTIVWLHTKSASAVHARLRDSAPLRRRLGDVKSALLSDGEVGVVFSPLAAEALAPSVAGVRALVDEVSASPARPPSWVPVLTAGLLAGIAGAGIAAAPAALAVDAKGLCPKGGMPSWQRDGAGAKWRISCGSTVGQGLALERPASPGGHFGLAFAAPFAAAFALGALRRARLASRERTRLKAPSSPAARGPAGGAPPSSAP